MPSLARSSLVHDYPRYLPAILAVSFASLLLLIQLALLLGLFQTVTSVIDRSGAQVWLTSPGILSFDQGAAILARSELSLRSLPEVERTEQVQMVFADVLTPRGAKLSATVIGYDLHPEAFVMPPEFRPALADAMRLPGGVVVDEADADKLDATVGALLEINGHRAVVVGITKHFRSIGGVYIFTSSASAKLIAGKGIEVPETASFIAGRLYHPELAPSVCQQANSKSATKFYEAWTSKDLSRHTQVYWLFETGMGIGFLFSVVVGVVVGIVITSQTLRGVIIASLREFATLRALGIPLAALRSIVLELAAWIGTLGLACTAIVVVPLAFVAAQMNVTLSFPWWTITATVVFTFAVAFASGFFALRALYAAEPAELLR